MRISLPQTAFYFTELDERTKLMMFRNAFYMLGGIRAIQWTLPALENMKWELIDQNESGYVFRSKDIECFHVVVSSEKNDVPVGSLLHKERKNEDGEVESDIENYYLSFLELENHQEIINDALLKSVQGMGDNEDIEFYFEKP